MRVTIAHIAEDGDTSGFFPQLGKLHDRNRYRMLFVTIRKFDPALRQSLEASGVTCYSCDATARWQYPIAAIRLAAFLRRENVQIVHTHLFDPSVIGLLTAWFLRIPARVMTRHYSDYHTRIDKRWHVALDKLCNGLSARIIAVSEHTKDHLIREENAPAEKIRVIWNGIDFARVRESDAATRQKTRREFLEGDGFLILIVARLHAEKGHTYLFRALPELRGKLKKPFKLVVAGKGSAEAEYREEVRRLGIEDLVVFAGFRSDIAELIAAADVMVLPSVAEAFGLVLCEALYLRTPVVATTVGGIPELIADGVDGILVPPADPKALAEAIARLLNCEEERSRLAGAGRDKVVNRFQFERMMREYESVYEELIA